MKFLDAITKLKGFLDLFAPAKTPQQPAESNGKKKRIALVLSLIGAGLLLLLGAALLIRKVKQRRLEKEAKDEAETYYFTDPDADDYSEDGEEHPAEA